MSEEQLFNKYEVKKRDGTPVDPEAVYFVLRLDTDPFARLAAWTYVGGCENTYPELARDLRDKLLKLKRLT